MKSALIPPSILCGWLDPDQNPRAIRQLTSAQVKSLELPMSTSRFVSRRNFLALAGASACAALLSPCVRAADLAKLAEDDATAVALGYREDAAKVDSAKFPAHKNGQTCANCSFFAGTDKTPTAACQLFSGKSIAAKGWCSAYNAKT